VLDLDSDEDQEGSGLVGWAYELTSGEHFNACMHACMSPPWEEPGSPQERLVKSAPEQRPGRDCALVETPTW